jgi:hypothetical protein
MKKKICVKLDIFFYWKYPFIKRYNSFLWHGPIIILTIGLMLTFYSKFWLHLKIFSHNFQKYYHVWHKKLLITHEWPSWPCSHGSWIYNYLCNQCLSPLMLCEFESWIFFYWKCPFIKRYNSFLWHGPIIILTIGLMLTFFARMLMLNFIEIWQFT